MHACKNLSKLSISERIAKSIKILQNVLEFELSIFFVNWFKKLSQLSTTFWIKLESSLPRKDWKRFKKDESK